MILPEKGVKSIAQEDIKRDLWLHTQAKGDWSWYRQRMKDMGQVDYPTTKGICVGSPTGFSIVACDEGNLAGALSSVSLISLAKSIHHSQSKISFCLHFSCSEIEEYDLWIQDLSGKALKKVERRVITTESTELRSELNYLRIRKHLQTLARDLVVQE